MFVEKDKCAGCQGTSFTTSWQGRLYITDIKRSMIAEKVGIKQKGEYAIKVR